MSRYNEIINILLKHGFGYLAEALELKYPALKSFLPLKEEDRLTEPVRLRKAFEELGPTFIKFAQILSTRPDLFPKDYIDELRKLQDTVPPSSFEKVEKFILENLRIASLSEKFREFDKECIASASIGQVYRAVTLDGLPVVVKVKHPGIYEVVQEDLRIMMEVARLLDKNIEEARLYQPIDLVNEFSYTLREELDYVMEGQNADRFRKNFASVQGIYIPKIYWELTTKDVLVMEEIRGVKINDLAALDHLGYDRVAIAERAGRIILKSILQDGFFHADPHPGNIFIMANEVLGVMDYGMMGRLSMTDRRSFFSLLQAYVDRDVDDLTEQLILASPQGGADVDRNLFKRDMERILSRYYDLTIQQVSFSNVINDTTDLIHKYHLKLPPQYFLLLKSLVIVEGIGRELDPYYNVLAIVKPFLQEQFDYSRLLPEMGKQMLRNLLALNDLAQDLPRSVRDLLRQAREGRLHMDLHHEGIKETIAELDILANRISLAMIIASLIVGVSLLLQVYKPLHQLESLFSWILSGLIILTISLLTWILYDLFLKSRRW